MKDNIIPFLREDEGTPLPLSDEAIARACSTGDAAAITILFERFNPNVARYISRLLGTFDVDDLVQATFLEVLRGKTQYDGRASVTTWLFAIATNIVRHHRRTDNRKLRLMAAISRDIKSPSRDASHNLDSARQLERVRALLLELSDTQREAFVLCILEGYSAREAAQVLGTSEAAVWKRVCKARAKIRGRILEETP
ncbi:RNA polymerase sigma factor [Myxococcota bacterium]|nr:RNA polymerase sigma factor [Myxococcota bacterium]MBU1535573.1 RNA polymerase sigma factor [Myxococcota bacterium]